MNNKKKTVEINPLIKKEVIVYMVTLFAFCFLLATFISDSTLIIRGVYLVAGISLLIIAGLFLKKHQTTNKQIKLKEVFGFKWDSSASFLLATNIITIILAVIQKWNFPLLFFIYWCQAVIISLFNLIKILNLKNIKKEDITLNGGTLKKARNNGAIFFLTLSVILYGVYLQFILNNHPEFTAIALIILAIGLFFLNHLFSFIKNFKHDTEKEQSLSRFVLLPFVRTLPMHLIILFGFLLVDSKGMLLFLVLKTLVDVMMHGWEHKN